jgi:hypothetical protein
MKTEIKNIVFKLIMSANKSKPICANELSMIIKNKFNLKAFPGCTVRAIVNELRREEIPVLANNKGYWISYDKEEVVNQIVSMKCRIDIQQAAYTGLVNCLNSL